MKLETRCQVNASQLNVEERLDKPKGKKKNQEIILGEMTRLRPVQPRDLPQLMAWDQKEEIYRWAGKKFSCSSEAEKWYLDSSTNQRKTFAIETLSGDLAGEIEMLNISWRLHSAELRIFIGENSLWNKGLGTDAVKTFLKWVFRHTSLQTMFLRVDSENKRARRCYNKAGFRPKGKVRLDRMADDVLANVEVSAALTEKAHEETDLIWEPTTLILMEISKDKASA